MDIILAIIVWEIAKRTFKYTTIYQEWFKKSKGTVEKSNSLQEELELMTLNSIKKEILYRKYEKLDDLIQLIQGEDL